MDRNYTVCLDIVTDLSISSKSSPSPLQLRISEASMLQAKETCTSNFPMGTVTQQSDSVMSCTPKPWVWDVRGRGVDVWECIKDCKFRLFIPSLPTHDAQMNLRRVLNLPTLHTGDTSRVGSLQLASFHILSSAALLQLLMIVPCIRRKAMNNGSLLFHSGQNANLRHGGVSEQRPDSLKD
jgi:hypothetical protein